MSKKETTIRVSGRDLLVEMHWRRGSRHLRVSLGARNQLRVSVPWHFSERVAWEFVEKQRGWIEERLGQAPKMMSVSEWLLQIGVVSMNGKVFGAVVERSEEIRRSGYTFSKDKDVVIFQLPRDKGGETELEALVRSFAKDTLQVRLLFHVHRLGLELPALSIRDQVSRWGSCSGAKRISLNWRLVLVAPELQDYVVLHELAHLTEMNHSRRFWALLDRYDPNRRAHEQALDACSSEVMRVGRRS